MFVLPAPPKVQEGVCRIHLLLLSSFIRRPIANGAVSERKGTTETVTCGPGKRKSGKGTVMLTTTLQLSETVRNLYGKMSLTDEDISSLTTAQILERATERKEAEILIHMRNYFEKNRLSEGIRALQEVYIGWVHSNAFKENKYSEDVSTEILKIQNLLVDLAEAETWALPDTVEELRRKFTIEKSKPC